MAKVTIVGDALVITSSLKLEDIKTVQKYRPEALILRGEKEEMLYAICASRGVEGTIDENGAAFCSETHDEHKNAVITMVLPRVEGDIKEWVADKIGQALTKLKKLEETIPAVLEQVKAEKTAVMEAISIQ